MQITEEMIEAAAQAIRKAFANRGRGMGRDWNALPEQVKQDYRAEAKAALRAALAAGTPHDRVA